MTDLTKRCTRCKRDLLLIDFHRKKGRRGGEGRTAVCRQCAAVLHAAKPHTPPQMDGTKTCTVCKETKPVTNFPAYRSAKDGRHQQCKACHSLYERNRRRDNPEYVLGLRRTMGKASELMRRYGLTMTTYANLVAAQGGGCALCGKTPVDKNRHLSVDHDSACCSVKKGSCGKCIRGLLCSNCNIGLGNFQHDPALLRRAAVYLEQPRVVV